MIKIGGKFIGPGCPPYVVAEMSANHGQSLEVALNIVKAAAEAGVDAIKVQTYLPSSLTMDVKTDDFKIDSKNSLWGGKYLYDLYDEAHMPWEWHKPIFDYAKSLGLNAFSTPFDVASVDFLEEVGAPCYKVASFENNDLELIEYIAKTGKPVFVSTGMATLADIELLVEVLKEFGNGQFVLLKCTSSYPSDARFANLNTIPNMMSTFGCLVGLSDHTKGTAVGVAATALGAVLIEKHFTLRRSDGGPDAEFSMEPDEMKALVEETKLAWRALGQIQYGVNAEESGSVKFKRSLYFCKDLGVGDIITMDNVRVIRPGFGLAPINLETILGLELKKPVRRGAPVTWEAFK